MITIAANGFILLGGTWNFYIRAAGLCFGALLAGANMAAIIITGKLRYNNMGQYCALSLTPSWYDGVDDETGNTKMSNDHTYSSDANLITFLWVSQMLLCVSQGFCWVYALPSIRQISNKEKVTVA